MNGHLHLSVNLNNEVEIKHAINILEIFYNQDLSKITAKQLFDLSIDPQITTEQVQDALKKVKKDRKDYHQKFAKNQYGTFPRKIKIKGAKKK